MQTISPPPSHSLVAAYTALAACTVGERTMLARCICHVDETTSMSEMSRLERIQRRSLLGVAPSRYQLPLSVPKGNGREGQCLSHCVMSIGGIISVEEWAVRPTLLANRRGLDLVIYPSTTAEICDYPG